MKPAFAMRFPTQESSLEWITVRPKEIKLSPRNTRDSEGPSLVNMSPHELIDVKEPIAHVITANCISATVQDDRGANQRSLPTSTQTVIPRRHMEKANNANLEEYHK
jgi:hypothetical protein